MQENLLEIIVIQEATKPIVVASGLIGLLFPDLMLYVNARIQEQSKEGKAVDDGAAYDIIAEFLGGPVRTTENFRDCWSTVATNAIRKSLAGEKFRTPTHIGEGHA